jgi:hypothetical protein
MSGRIGQDDTRGFEVLLGIELGPSRNLHRLNLNLNASRSARYLVYFVYFVPRIGVFADFCVRILCTANPLDWL